MSRQLYDYYEISTEPALSTFSKFFGLLSTLLLNSTCFAGKECNIKIISLHFMTLTTLVDSSLVKDLVTIVGLDGDLLYLRGRLKTQSETLRESPSGHPAGVTERYFGKVVSAESI